VQQADGVLFVIVRAKGIGADHFGQIAGAMGEGGNFGPHLVNNHLHAHVGGLPCCLGPGHAAAYDVQYLFHSRADSPSTHLWKGLRSVACRG